MRRMSSSGDGGGSEDALQRAATAIGARIRHLREERGWTLERAGEQMGLDPKHLWKLENAWGSGNPTLATLLKVADGLGCSLTDLTEVVPGSDGKTGEDGTPGLTFVENRDAAPYETDVPVFTLEAAAGAFGSVQPVEPMCWARLPGQWNLHPGMFVARVRGASMEPLIHDGDWALFSSPVEGSRQGRIVLVEHRGIADPDSGGSYTIKRYESEKVHDAAGQWRHTRIRLVPVNPEYDTMEITDATADELRVIAELVETFPGGR